MGEEVFDLWHDVPTRQYGVKALLHRRGGPDGCQPLRPRERVAGDGVPEAGGVEEGGDSLGVFPLKDAHQVTGDADLQAVQARPGGSGIKSVRDQMFTATGWPRRTANLHRDPIE